MQTSAFCRATGALREARQGRTVLAASMLLDIPTVNDVDDNELGQPELASEKAIDWECRPVQLLFQAGTMVQADLLG